MLHIPKIPPEVQNYATLDRPPRAMSGRRLNRLVKNASPRDRALLAYDLERGVVQLSAPTRAQAATLTKASTGYIGTLARLSEDERGQVAKGEASISRFQTHKQLTDAEFDRVVARHGIDALWRALERATAPANRNAANGMAAE